MITYLAISHSHWDHVGNANDYAGSTWLARKAEYDFMFRSDANPVALKNYDKLAHGNIKFIDGDYDVFGDGSVVLLYTPGHSPGHQSLYLKLAHTGGVVISGDLYHYTAERKLVRCRRANRPPRRRPRAKGSKNSSCVPIRNCGSVTPSTGTRMRSSRPVGTIRDWYD